MSESPARSWQGGILFYTPENLENDDVDPGDRPYANLLFLARSHERANPRTIDRLTVSGGIIGSRLGASAFRALHDATDSTQANGFDTQISDGGEPTLRLGWTRYTSLRSRTTQFGHITLLSETAASVGYATDASFGVALRISRHPHWWGSARNQFLNHLDEPQRQAATGFFAGMRLRAVGYNALLQGQFRHSDHTLPANHLKRLVGQAWLGFATHYRHLSIRYALQVQTADYDGGRSQIWGSLTLGLRG